MALEPEAAQVDISAAFDHHTGAGSIDAFNASVRQTFSSAGAMRQRRQTDDVSERSQKKRRGSRAAQFADSLSVSSAPRKSMERQRSYPTVQLHMFENEMETP